MNRSWTWIGLTDWQSSIRWLFTAATIPLSTLIGKRGESLLKSFAGFVIVLVHFLRIFPLCKITGHYNSTCSAQFWMHCSSMLCSMDLSSGRWSSPELFCSCSLTCALIPTSRLEIIKTAPKNHPLNWLQLILWRGERWHFTRDLGISLFFRTISLPVDWIIDSNRSLHRTRVFLFGDSIPIPPRLAIMQLNHTTGMTLSRFIYFYWEIC